ncbi:MAG: superoxide dismutase [Candidatus Hermodarchaeota archaeon]
MKIIAIEKELEGSSEEDFKKFANDEAKQVWHLYQEGTIREIYFRQDIHTAVIILECIDIEETKKILSSLPFVKNKLIEFELFPLIPYNGFSRLFKQDIE